MTKARFGVLAVATLVGLGVLLAYLSGTFHSKVAEDAAAPTVRYPGELAQAVAEVKPALEQVPGTVQATSDTLIASRIMANILRVGVRAGAQVKDGDLLVELDDKALREARAQRAQEAAAAEASLQDATLARQRTESLRQAGSISQAALDRAITDERRAAAEFERAQRAVAEADAAIGYTRIAAPMAGTIVERYAEPGDTAAPGQPLLKLFNPGQMRVEATVRESLIGFVAVGDTLDATIDARQKTVPSVVEEIVPSADPTSRTFLLKARLTDIEGLFPGMFARLTIPVASTRRVWVPMRAVQEAGQLRFVYVRGDETDARRFVRLGDESGDLVEVRSGLEGGETVVMPTAAG